MSVRVRFAPSPTGLLHIGNIRTALFNFLFARHEKGKWILRIEDTDPERSKKEFSEALMRNLETLGLQWDEGPFYQSERLSLYLSHLETLREKDLVYPCYCTEDELKARRKEALLQKKPPRYDNRCRRLTKEDIRKKEAEGIRPVIRFKVTAAEPIEIVDLIRGRVHFNPAEIGDFVVMRPHPGKKGELLPTFHMSVCVDDGLMKVTHIIRGEDHLSNCPRHVLLFQAFGMPVPHFAHLSLIHGQAGEPLSKRLAAVHVKDFIKKQGYLPEALLNYLALLGWSPKDNREVMPLETIIKEFRLENALRHPAIFNEEKLGWINSEHLRLLPEKDYQAAAVRFLESLEDRSETLHSNRTVLEKSLLLVRTDIQKFGDLPKRLNFLPDPQPGSLGGEEKTVLSAKEAGLVLAAADAVLGEDDSLEGEALFSHLSQEVKAKTNVKGKALFMPLRVALTGHCHGPELKKLFSIFDRGTLRRRIQNSMTNARA